jgi:threonine dehydratase
MPRTPLLPFDGVWLKLENLQPIGSFKIRGCRRSIERLPCGTKVWTASAGNMGYALAWCSSEIGLDATIVVPETAPAVKTDAIARCGAKIVRLPRDAWWACFQNRAHPGIDGRYIPAFDSEEMLEGNAEIGREILEELPDVQHILVPWGGGGLACGIARAAPGRVRAVEVETAAPLRASLDAGRPVTVEIRPSFVDGIGGKSCFLYEKARDLGIDSLVVTLDEVREAIRRLAFGAKVIAEGAGAAAFAARTRARGVTACVISGGNIDPAVLAEIFTISGGPRH